MATVFEPSTRDALIKRINKLDQHTKAVWGKMNAYQVATHCALWEEMIHRNKIYERPLIGRLIGPMILRKVLKDDAPMRKNSPTIPDLIINETNGNFETEKGKWISMINGYSTYSLPDYTFVHPFFGKMTRDQIGRMAYKHNDHHLRQFGV
ncbi:MAG: DUF1569 domain-containing protein [Chryseolinea sp.]